jgi:transposase
MKDNERQIRARKNWLKVYQDVGSVSKAALRCGVARSTMYRWIKRYSEEGESGLSDKSKRPKNLTNTKVSKEIELLILELRRKKKWGAQRISIHLLRKNIRLSPMTVWRVLSNNNVSPIVKRRKKSDYKRYNKEIPGERVQLDVTKIRKGAYQFTAIDDCTRMKTIRIYPNKKVENTIHFLSEVIDTFGFPIQRIQTDWGTEFFNYDFQYELHEHFIKFRPIRPKTPHLNGKVERTQQTVYFTPKVYQYFNPKVYHFNLISKSVSLLGAVPPPTGKRAFLF